MKKLIDRYYSTVLAHKWYFFSMIIFFVVGIVLGIVFCKGEEKVQLGSNAIDYYCMAMKKESGVFSLFVKRIFAFLGVFVVFGLCGLILELYPVHFVIITYRGYILGAVSTVFIVTFGISGIIFLFFVVLVENLIISFALLLYSVTMLANLKNSCSKLQSRKKFLESSIVAICIALIGAICELLILALVIRPTSFYF